MLDAGPWGSEHFAVVDDAADRRPAEADAMIAALTADQAGARSLALDLVKGQRDLERGIGGFRPGIAEKYVIQSGGRELGDAACELKGLGNTELERRGIIPRFVLLCDPRPNLGAGQTRICAPHSRCCLHDLSRRVRERKACRWAPPAPPPHPLV